MNLDTLAAAGVSLIAPDELVSGLGMDDEVWAQFGAHWEDLAPDPYAAELGMQRLRRYGHYTVSDGVATAMRNGAFVQPDNSNPLYVDRDRHFQPLTDAFAREPLVTELITLLYGFASALDEAAEWTVKVHPFRVIAWADGEGQPTPEGLHRDGVTLVTSLLINRRNAVGGESTVFDATGNHLLTTTLSEPGTLLLGDDRCTLHGVSPIRPFDESAPALRDVLVITFAS